MKPVMHIFLMILLSRCAWTQTIINVVDFRFFDEISLVLELNKNLGIYFSFVYRYDNRPPSSLKRYDISLKNGVIQQM